MNVQEMHIDVNLVTQKIASNIFRKFDPSEIDWLLNREVERYIKDRIKRDQDSMGFEATEVDLDAIRTLVVNDLVLAVRKQATTDRTVFAWLPGDYSYMVDDYSVVLQACNKTEYFNGINFAATLEYVYAFPLKVSTASFPGPFYSDYNITYAGDTILEQVSGPGLSTPDELFTFRDVLMSKLWRVDNGNTTWYWERYGNVYKQNCILAVSINDFSAFTNSITIDGSPQDAVQTVQSYFSVPVITPAKVADREPVPNRLIKGSSRSNVLKSAFAKSRASSPVSSVDGNLLRAYHDTKFIVNNLIISYIRKPAKISLALGVDCDLPEEFHSQIVDRTQVTIKELTANPDWQMALQSMMLNKE